MSATATHVASDAAPKITNPDKVLWPEDGFTKRDLLRYYRAVAPRLLPHLQDRPLTLQRWPNGIHGPSFFEKQIPRGAPQWIARVKLPSTGKRAFVCYPICNDLPSLLYFGNLAAITLHVWTSRVATLDVPDYALLDLDPYECGTAVLAKVALAARRELEAIGLHPVVKTSGGSGLHVLVPLEPRYAYDEVKRFAELSARRIARALPELVTLERSLARRPKGTVYVDWVQVGKGKTIVPPFALRARPGAPVSTPLAWAEVERLARSRSEGTANDMRRWNIESVPALLAKEGDPWRGAWRAQRLERALVQATKSWR